MIPCDLTASEVLRAKRRHIFTVTTETTYGYYVTVLRLKNGTMERLAQSKECRKPRTARIYGARLVRAALLALTVGCGSPFSASDTAPPDAQEGSVPDAHHDQEGSAQEEQDAGDASEDSASEVSKHDAAADVVTDAAVTDAAEPTDALPDTWQTCVNATCSGGCCAGTYCFPTTETCEACRSTGGTCNTGLTCCSGSCDLGSFTCK